MPVVNYLTQDSLVHQFQIGKQTRFSGRLDLQPTTTTSYCWKLYFSMGQLVWAVGGVHRWRRWGRGLMQFCPHIDPGSVSLEVGSPDTWEYLALTTLTKQGRLTHEQSVEVIEQILTEILFDILQAVELQRLSYTTTSQARLELALTSFDYVQILGRAQQALKVWCHLGLKSHSPNLAPVMQRPEELQQQMSPQVYQKVASLMNERLTLRDLAAKMRQDVVVLTHSLMPYVQQRLIGLVEVEDLPSPSRPAQAANSPAPTTKRPLVVCVDDSVQICKRLEEILTQVGCRFVGVQNSVQALPVILENKPGLIFLDLVMPVANGYEICSQIRRISAFKQTPVVILTGNDGILDRVRAKAVGASDFLAKPVRPEQVLAVVHKHLKLAVTAR